jgi:hypothetical protein
MYTRQELYVHHIIIFADMPPEACRCRVPITISLSFPHAHAHVNGCRTIQSTLTPYRHFANQT